MIAESRPLSTPRPSGSQIVVAAFVAIAVFVVTWSLLHVGFYTRNQVIDTPVYQRYGNAIARGQVPYRDFAVEYPPGALPMFALPGLAKPGHDQDVTPGFKHAFEALMWLCGAVALGAAAATLVALRAAPRRAWRALLYASVAPLALGAVILSRFDLWPTALLALAIAAYVWRRPLLGSVLLGVATTAKFYPAVVLPAALIYVWREWGVRRAAACAAAFAVVVALVFAPFVALSPHGVWSSISVQLTRPLQIESLGAAVLVAAHHAWGFHVAQTTSHGSQNLTGHSADVVAALVSVVQVAVLVAVWSLYARSRGTAEGFVRAAAASVAAFVAFGKVLSPQFLIWLIPLVPLVRGRRGIRATVILAGALVATQLYFPYRYWDYVNAFAALPSWLVLARDVALVALSVLLALPQRDDSPSPTPA